METFALKFDTVLLRLIFSLSGKRIQAKNASLYPFCQLSVRGGGSINIGRNAQIHRGAMVVSTYQSIISLGKDTSLQPYSIIHGIGDIIIGDNTRIASHCMIVSGDHRYIDKNILIRKQGIQELPITIGSDVWIGSGVRVLGGSIIGNGCVVGAGSVVKGVLNPYAVYVGTPARKIRERA